MVNIARDPCWGRIVEGAGEDLAFYDAALRRVAEPGRFTVFVGSSSDAVKEARFELTTPGARSVPVPESCSPRQ